MRRGGEGGGSGAVRRIAVVARGHTAEHHGHDATFDPNIESCFSSHAIDCPESFV